MLVRYVQGMSDKLLAGFVGLSFLIALGLSGLYLVFTSVFYCQAVSCSGSIWNGLLLVMAGLLIFTFSLFGRYDTRFYTGK